MKEEGDRTGRGWRTQHTVGACPGQSNSISGLPNLGDPSRAVDLSVTSDRRAATLWKDAALPLSGHQRANVPFRHQSGGTAFAPQSRTGTLVRGAWLGTCPLGTATTAVGVLAALWAGV